MKQYVFRIFFNILYVKLFKNLKSSEKTTLNAILVINICF